MTLCIHILKLPVKGTPGFRNQILPTLKKQNITTRKNI